MTVDVDAELAVGAMDAFDLLVELALEQRRHPGGVQRGESVAAVADGDAGHGALRRERPAT